MTVNKTINATAADQWDSCGIPGSGWADTTYNFDRIGGDSTANKWMRGLVYFDLSTVAYGAIFSSVILSVYLNSNDANQTHDFYVYRVTSEWDSAFVTNTVRMGGPTNWTSAGGDYTDLCSNLSIAWNEAAGWKAFEFSAGGRTVLHQMNNGTYSNYGFLLRSSTEDDDSQHLFDDANDTYPPKIALVYTVPSAGRTMVIF